MDPHAIRAELLEQHAALRMRLEKGRKLATDGSARDLHDALLDIANYLRLHHMREEEVLREVFPTLDDWGMIRAATMVEEHADEHRQLFETLLVVSTTADQRLASATALELFDRILAHMAEERLFLGPDDEE